MNSIGFKKKLILKKQFYRSVKTCCLLLLFLILSKQKLYSQSGSTRSLSRPNILIITADDLMWSGVSMNDSLSIFPTPNINRIGMEGLTVKNYYSTNAICIPGRATMLSGKYGHITGAVNNCTQLLGMFKTFPQILHDSGYYTALCGKWMVNNSSNPRPEFDYWLWTPYMTSYINDTCQYFDSTFIATGHITDMLTDSVLSLIGRVDTPFCILLNHNAPHSPYIPQPQFQGMFDNSFFHVPGNFPAYTNNYPTEIYRYLNFFVEDTNEFQSVTRSYYELLAGLEVSVGKILDSLSALGVLDQTMVIFTTDNGFMIGPHQLMGKQYPYEEVMKMPLMIRYPPWFQAGSTIDSSFVLNPDFAPTILDAAGIPQNYGMQGSSVRNIYNHTYRRDEFMYEVIPCQDSVAQVRAVRTPYFQYNRYYCIDTTEELFDMVNDKLQITNLVKNQLYQNVLYQYRIKLDSLRTTLNDTMTIENVPCHLVVNSLNPLEQSGTDFPFVFYPVPATEKLFIHSSRPAVFSFELFNSMGQKVKTGTLNFSSTQGGIINLDEISSGVYMAIFKNACSFYSSKFTVIK